MLRTHSQRYRLFGIAFFEENSTVLRLRMTPEEHNFVGDPGGAVIVRFREAVEIAN